MVKEIPLSRSVSTMVDDEDYDNLSQWKWCAIKDYNTFYALRNVKKEDGSGERRHERMHRIITNAPAGMVVDHINGDGLDNRRCNLRVCTNAQNVRNSKKKSRGGTSKYKGVSYARRPKKWVAQINSEFLGYFPFEDEAAIAYNKAAKERFGGFARLNSIQGSEDVR